MGMFSAFTLGSDISEWLTEQGSTECHLNGPALAAWTRLRTARGLCRLDELEPGDQLATRDNGYQPLLGVRLGLADPFTLPCIMIRRNTFCNVRDLVVSAEQALLFTSWQAELYFQQYEVLAPAQGLVNGASVRELTGGLPMMGQIIMEHHQIIFAEDQPMETMHPRLITPEEDWPTGVTAESFGPSVRTRLRPWEAEILAPMQ